MKIQKDDEFWMGDPSMSFKKKFPKAEKKPKNSRFFHMLRKGFEMGKFVRM